jgi:hypothetical protein
MSTSRAIAFPKNHYRQTPNIAAGFSKLDISCEGPVRANLLAENISKDFFTIAVETWGEKAILTSANVAWVEHKASAKDCVFGQFDTRGAFSPSEIPVASPRIKKKALQIPQKHARPFIFRRPFEKPPHVICWLNRLDLASGPDHNYKLRAFADEVGPDGFLAHLNTWDDGLLHGAAMCWIAFPKSKRNVDCGKFSTMDVRKRTNPRLQTRGKVRFRRAFENVPLVIVALSMIDAAGNADLRVNVMVEDVGREGFGWVIGTWGDSTLYAAGGSWIALGP